MSLKLLPTLLLACLLLCSQAIAAPDTAPATPAAGVLTPEQAKRALETLSDDKKRAEVIETLRAVANASQPTQAAASEPKSSIPLTADSLGAQLLLTLSEQVREVSREVADVARALTHYRAF